MSESEKLQREQYQTKRNRKIFVQRGILIILAAALLICTVAYWKLDKDTYVYYAEEGNAIHKAYLEKNDFYEEGYLNGSHAYVSSLVQKMTADFSYELKFFTDKVDFKYNYRIDAQLEISDKASNSPLYNPTYEILPLKTDTSTGNTLTINELVEIDYQKYNAVAKAYLETFELKDATATLVIRMYTNVIGESESFAKDRSGEYVTELRIPLNKVTFKPEVTSTVPSGEQKILAINENVKESFGIAAIALFGLTFISAVILAVFTVKTRDKHIDYRIRVERVLKNYKSYIQCITSEFNMDGYQILRINDITELLDIRDTLHKPILAYENEDKTCSDFFIVADFKIIYLYHIEVEEEA